MNRRFYFSNFGAITKNEFKIIFCILFNIFFDVHFSFRILQSGFETFCGLLINISNELR
jgi:hypothetical protein